MDANKVELAGAELLLEKGVEVKLPAPFFMKLAGRRTITMRMQLPTAWVLAEVTRLYLLMGIKDAQGLTLADSMAMYTAHQFKQARMIALCMLPYGIMRKLFVGPLAVWLNHSLSQRQMSELLELLLLAGGIKDFTNTIRLLEVMKITTPNLSRTSNGS